MNDDPCVEEKGELEMDVKEILKLYATSEESDEFKKAKEAVRTSLAEDESLSFRDVDGDGTHYRCVGLRHGVGYAVCDVHVGADGLVWVEGTCMPIAEVYQRDLSRLCRMWNEHFILKGFLVDEGQLAFRSEPFDATDGDMSASRAVRMVFSTFHDYASAPLALEAGVDPWELINLDEACGGTDDEDDGDSEDVREAIERIERRLGILEYVMLEK